MDFSFFSWEPRIVRTWAETWWESLRADTHLAEGWGGLGVAVVFLLKEPLGNLLAQIYLKVVNQWSGPKCSCEPL